MESLAPRPGRFTPGERDPVPTVQDAGWAPGPIWMAAENLAPTGIRSPDRPSRSESLYRLSYRGPLTTYIFLSSIVGAALTVHFAGLLDFIFNGAIPTKLDFAFLLPQTLL
jgi:hypothetical protein